MLRRVCFSVAVLAASCFVACEASAQEFVSGHWRHNPYGGGYTYVHPYIRSLPDGNFYNNWSTYPNINPYTGAMGTHHRPSYGYGTSYDFGGSTSNSLWNWFGW